MQSAALMQTICLQAQMGHTDLWHVLNTTGNAEKSWSGRGTGFSEEPGFVCNLVAYRSLWI